jgi:hypothetical protein
MIKVQWAGAADLEWHEREYPDEDYSFAKSDYEWRLSWDVVQIILENDQDPEEDQVLISRHVHGSKSLL